MDKKDYRLFENSVNSILNFIIFVQLSFIIFINLTQLQYHIGYDASSYYLQTIEMSKQNTLFPDNWMYQTTLYTDSPVLLAMFFYSLFKNIFIAYGIANIICTFALLAIFCKLLKMFKLSKIAEKISIALLLSPYIIFPLNNGNDLGYFSMLFSSMGGYSVKIIIILLVVYIFCILHKNITLTCIDYVLLIITLFLVFFSGISSGYYILITSILPLLFYCIIVAALKNNLLTLHKKHFYFLLVLVLISLCGKYYSQYLLYFDSRETNMNLISLESFWHNFSSIWTGFINLLNGLPVYGNIEILSILGISYGVNLIISLVCIFSILYFIFTKCKGILLDINNEGTLLSIFVFNGIVFTFADTTYGSPIFETRYLIVFYILILFFIGMLLNDNLNKRIVILGLISLICLSNIISEKVYISEKIDYHFMNQLSDEINKLNVPVVYTFGNELTLLCRNMRVIDTKNVYKTISDDFVLGHWGDYTYFDDVSEYEKSTVLLTSKDKFLTLPVYIQHSYQPYKIMGDLVIYISDYNKFDFKSGITDEKISKDFFYTPGITTQFGEFDMDGAYVIANEHPEGFVSWGPYTYVNEGQYDFILKYTVLDDIEDNIGVFDVATDSGTKQWGYVELKGKENIAIIKNIELPSINSLEYRVYLKENIKMKLESIEIVRVQ